MFTSSHLVIRFPEVREQCRYSLLWVMGGPFGHFRIWIVDAAINESTKWVDIFVKLSVAGNTFLASKAHIAILSETPSVHLRIHFLQPTCLVCQDQVLHGCCMCHFIGWAQSRLLRTSVRFQSLHCCPSWFQSVDEHDTNEGGRREL